MTWQALIWLTGFMNTSVLSILLETKYWTNTISASEEQLIAGFAKIDQIRGI